MNLIVLHTSSWCLRFGNHLRPILVVDETVFKERYKGTIYIGFAMDGNKQIYPLTFGIEDGENDVFFFLFNLKNAFGGVPNLVFVIDSHKLLKRYYA